MKAEKFFDTFSHKTKLENDGHIYKISTKLIEIMSYLFFKEKNIENMTIDEIMATEIESGNYLGRVRDFVLWNFGTTNNFNWHSSTSFIHFRKDKAIQMLEEIKI